MVLFVAALAFAAGAIGSTFTDLNLRTHGVTTNATIVDVHMSYSRKSGTTYSDQVAYTASDGSRHEATLGGGRSSQRAGQTIAVVYDPSHPDTVQAKSSLGGLWWIGPVVLLVFALVFGWLGWRLWRRASRRDEAQPAANVFG